MVINPLVSIVVPVYNGALYIQKCLDSISVQTYGNIEILVVDDGSTDGSGSICDSAASKDLRMKVFHQSNGGVNSARQKGVDNARGEWLVFVDADDTLPEDAINNFIAGTPSDSEIAISSKSGQYDTKEYLIALLSGEIGPELWEKMFRTSIFKTYSPRLDRKIAMGEDLLINLVVGLHAKSISTIESASYCTNRDNEQSVTKTFKKTWEYEKYYFSELDKLFLSQCRDLPYFPDLEALVQKSKLNGIKYIMLCGNKVDYSDEAFTSLASYFKGKKELLGPSERLALAIRNSTLYRMILKTYLKFRPSK